MTDFIFQAKDAAHIDLLKASFGWEITLTEGGRESVYRLLKEFRLGETDYAVLQPDDCSDDDGYVIFRIVKDGGGNLELETIDDDEEWEAVAEVYDEMTFEP